MPSSAAITATPRPNPPASTALRTGRDSSDECEPDDHRVASSTMRPSRILRRRPAREPPRVVGHHHDRGAVRVQPIEERRRSVPPSLDRARRSARRRAATAAGWPAHARWRPAASLRPRARDGRCAARCPRPTYREARVRCGARTIHPSSACGSSTFSEAVSIGSRKNRWNTNPISRSRSRLRPHPEANRRPSTERAPRRCRQVHAPQDVEEGGLAASRRSDHADVLRGRNLQRHVVEGGDRTARHRKHA